MKNKCRKIKLHSEKEIYWQVKSLIEDNKFTGELLYYYWCSSCKSFHITRKPGQKKNKIDFLKLMYPNLQEQEQPPRSSVPKSVE